MSLCKHGCRALLPWLPWRALLSPDNAERLGELTARRSRTAGGGRKHQTGGGYGDERVRTKVLPLRPACPSSRIAMAR